MDRLQKDFDKFVENAIKSLGSQQEIDGLADALPKKLQEMVDVLPREILENIKESADEGLDERRKLHSEFVERNYSRWKGGFDVLELLIEISIESGESFNERVRTELVKSHDATFDILVRLHAKGCLIGKEILTLLLNGYADGAHARWRALHEIAITARFLEKHGEAASRRYLDHEYVEAYRGASQLRKYQSRINTKGFSEKEFEEFRRDYDSVIYEYGKEFGKPYGWAKPFLPNKGNATFSALEEAVEMDRWRPYYKWASQNIHANIKTIRSSLGMSECTMDGVQVGPSNSGMTDPAHSTAITVTQLTCTLLCYSPNLDDLVSMKLLSSLSDEVGEKLVRCD